MSKKWIITLLAGYAAGLAIALKYKKDARQTSLEQKEEEKTTLIDDIVDIHKQAFSEIKNKVQETLDECKDMESLKNKASFAIDNFKKEAEELIASLESKRETGKEKIEEALAYLYEKKQALLDEAKTKWTSIANEVQTVTAEVEEFILELKNQLETTYNELKNTINTSSNETDKDSK